MHHTSKDESIVKVRRIRDGLVFERTQLEARALMNAHPHDFALVPLRIPSARQILERECSSEELLDLCRAHQIVLHPNASRESALERLLAALDAGTDAQRVMVLGSLAA